VWSVRESSRQAAVYGVPIVDHLLGRLDDDRGWVDTSTERNEMAITLSDQDQRRALELTDEVREQLLAIRAEIRDIRLDLQASGKFADEGED
jgi:hypothetical protein